MYETISTANMSREEWLALRKASVAGRLCVGIENLVVLC